MSRTNPFVGRPLLEAENEILFERTSQSQLEVIRGLGRLIGEAQSAALAVEMAWDLEFSEEGCLSQLAKRVCAQGNGSG